MNDPQIHYRLRGEDVTIRLKIDGYELNTFNELLFLGARLEVKQSLDFAWHTQAQDLKNHLGHRAYIEIIDHGKGFVELDEIRFADVVPPAHAATQRSPVAAVSDENTDVAGFISQTLVDQLQREAKTGSRELTGWIIKHDLAEVFAKPDKNNEVSIAPAETTSYVALGGDSPNAGRSAAALMTELTDIRDKIQQLNEITPEPELAIALTDGTGEDEHVFVRGNHKTLGDVATRRFLSAISARPLNPIDGSGRRELAHKITAPNNPLTSRVIVNRIWHHLMGRGIVESVDNFGVLGKKPTHPELLDHLATSFRAGGWSMKKMIRRIVLTQTYRMSSHPDTAASQVDPRNELLHRAHIKRLTGESIRDSILLISGQLDATMFGPSVPVHLTPFMQGRGRPAISGPLDGDGRRSVYIAVQRNFLSPLMLAFDTPIPFNTIGRRNQSNVPAQALILMNDPFVTAQAKKWAVRLIQETDSVPARIDRIYLQSLGRMPSKWEMKKASHFVEQQATELEIDPESILHEPQIWKHLCHVMFNLKEFIFIK